MVGRGRPSRTTLYQRLDAALAELNQRLGGLPSPQEAAAVWDDIWHAEAHHSTALEGNTLVLHQVEALLDEGRAIGAKTLKEYLEVRGYGEAARWVYAQALQPGGWSDGLVTVTEVRHVHYLAMTPVWDVAPVEHATPAEAPGNWREHDIEPFAGGMSPPSWALVPARVQQWAEECCAFGEQIKHGKLLEKPLPERLAHLHAELERIHPFLDGNGRVGRLVLNLLLVRLGYPPVIITKQQRAAYLIALHRADAGDCGALGELVARAMLNNLNRFVVPSVAGPARLIPLAALVDDGLSLAALRQAAQRGRLEAYQGADGVWRSSRKAVEAYKASKYQRGHKARP